MFLKILSNSLIVQLSMDHWMDGADSRLDVEEQHFWMVRNVVLFKELGDLREKTDLWNREQVVGLFHLKDVTRSTNLSLRDIGSIIDGENFLIRDRSEAMEDTSKLDLMERVEFHQQSMFDVEVKTPDGEVRDEVELFYLLRESILFNQKISG